MSRPEAIPSPESTLPAYEALPTTVRRIVREELVPVLDAIDALRADLSLAASEKQA